MVTDLNDTAMSWPLTNDSADSTVRAWNNACNKLISCYKVTLLPFQLDALAYATRYNGSTCRDNPLCNSNRMLSRGPDGSKKIMLPTPAMAVQRGISFKRFAESKLISALKLLKYPMDKLTEGRLYGKQN